MNPTPLPQHTPARAPSKPTPWWQHETVVRVAVQALFLAVVLLIVGYFYRNMMRSLSQLGLGINFRFMMLEAGFGISEGIAYELTDSYARAFWVGIVNTLKVVSIGILIASGIGLLMGLARLSSNWLVRSVAQLYVEIFRNVPLLLQLFFWYTAVILKLPPVRQAINLYDRFFLSQRGLYGPRLLAGEGFAVWRWFLIAGIIGAALIYVVRRRQLRRLDRPGFPSLWALGGFVAITAVGLLVADSTFVVELPVLERFNFAGGLALTPEFTSLLIGLAVYTGAFIAEVVRGGIQAVEKGQREAATALGLRPAQVTYLVIIPQALRSIIPPLTNQYLNLAKNSSLAVAIGYPELFNIGTTTMNQTGQTIPVFLIIVASYLTLSLLTSLFMNWWNKKIRLVDR